MPLTEELIRSWIDPWLDPVLGRYASQIRKLESGHEACISLQDWQIQLAFDVDLLARLQDAFGLDEPAVEEPASSLAAYLYLHEVGHWSCCPFDSDGYERILSGLSAGLPQVFRTSRERASSLVHTLQNVFSDIMLNAARANTDPDPRVSETFRKGWGARVRFFLHRENELNQATTVFVALQHRLIRPADPVLDRMVQGLLRQPVVESTVEKLSAVFRARETLVNDRSRWEDQAKRFAEIFAPLLAKTDDPGRMDVGRRRGPSKTDHGQRRGSSKQAGQLPGSGSNKTDHAGQHSPGNSLISTCGGGGFGNRFKTDPRFRREIIQQALKRGKKPADLLFAPEETVLRVLYEEKAEEIALQAHSQEEQGCLAVTHTGVQRIEPGQAFRVDSIKWSATRWYPSEGWRLYRKINPLTVPLRGGTPAGLLPDLLFALDSSGSMGWTRGQGEGAYDLALTAFFGIRRWLERSGLAQYIRFAAINFSSTTHWTGWHRYSDFDAVFDVLLRYQGGGTRLDPGALVSLAAKASDPVWMLVMTDGEITNGEELRRTMRNLIRQRHRVTLIQLGPATDFSRGLANDGGDVHVIKSAQDLVGLVLEQVKTVWT